MQQCSKKHWYTHPQFRKAPEPAKQISTTRKDGRLTIEHFAKEIRSDLAELLVLHPNGIHISHMQEYYGESSVRVHHACDILEAAESIVVQRTVSGHYYILPRGSKIESRLPELSELQRQIVFFIHQQCHEQKCKTLLTNYSQLASKMKCSYGGLRACLERLVKLKYLEIVVPSKQGKSQMILRLSDEVVSLLAHHLDT